MLGFWLVLIPGIIHINCIHVHEVFDVFLLSLIIYLLIDLLSIKAAVTTLTESPSDPSFAIETHNFTLVWKYTLDGSAAFAQFLNITGGGSGERIARQLSGSVNVEPKYQDRFTVVITDSQASCTDNSWSAKIRPRNVSIFLEPYRFWQHL